jgi:hypothetical protein
MYGVDMDAWWKKRNSAACDIVEWSKVNIAIMMVITMMTAWCAQACGLNSSVVYLNVKTHDVWEGSVTIGKWNILEVLG